MEEYFDLIENNVKKIYEIAEEARKKGFDPDNKVEIPVARNMAERVEGLISIVAPQIKNSGVVERINELENIHGKLDWRVALIVSLEIAQEKFCKFKDKKEAMEVGIRVGLAYLTLGVVSSPLEGFTELKIKKRKDGKEYFCLMFSGPIRSAGTTVVCGSIVVADYIRQNMGYDIYDPTEQEVKRMVTELYDYHDRVSNLQYLPSEDEIDFLVRNLPIQIDGEPSEEYEVSNYKDLERIETNRIRNGPCLVLGEAVAQKSSKLWAQLQRWKKDFGLENWNFISDFLVLQKKVKSKGKSEEKKTGINPDFTYIKDLPAGRPVLGHPLAKGGLRLRYGRCRTSGLSSLSISPVTMKILNNYIGTGTQLRYERPGKSTAVQPCDTIEGPIVKLRDGSVLFLENEEEAEKASKHIEEILFLGDILINYGEFFNRAHVLIPCGYNEEWYCRELEKALGKEVDINEIRKIGFDQALKISLENKIPLHPRYTFHFWDINKKQFLSLLEWIEEGKVENEKIILLLKFDIEEIDRDPKRTLELLGIPHKVLDKKEVLIEGDWAKALKLFLLDKKKVMESEKETALDIINELSGVKLRDKSGTFIGARMGRPEKAKMRKLDGSPHVLFPVGKEGGRLRCFQAALEIGSIKSQFPIYYCENCKKETIFSICEECGNKCIKKFYCGKCGKTLENDNCNVHGKIESFRNKDINIKNYFKSCLKKLGLNSYPELIKGVRGTSNKEHIPENLAKGILRAVNGVYVNKDGTIRYDITEMGITHFRAREIGVSVEKLKKLGYEKDIYGKELINDEQLIEIKPQDIILPCCKESPDKGADEVLFNVANFVDDSLQKIYGLNKFYNLKNKEELVGHLVIGIAPHTSAAIIGRIIGFSNTQGLYAHPLWHSAQRRDLEGDETSIILLMDALLNFSKKYLPAHRGATQDAPLVITSRLVASEVDDMVFDMDICSKYPLKLYEYALQYKNPREVKEELKIEQVKDRLGKENQYFNYGFTHDTFDINEGVRCSAYKTIPTMEEKVNGQMDIAEKIRAVDEADVARLVIERHFIRDIKGNLRQFGIQSFRCVNCNEIYRRPPLIGKCLLCGGKIIFTVAEGSIVKYLDLSFELARKYNLPAYLKQTLVLTKQRIESIFGKEKDKQVSIANWFG